MLKVFHISFQWLVGFVDEVIMSFQYGELGIVVFRCLVHVGSMLEFGNDYLS